ncbi:MAG: 16S rRNA (uracil(1498)-N(3))-methyltransferase [Alphaproteobacteria bacterium]|nr:16S rRNA (uracil(1498)-N(3))-methyltransferase [Alphaproteobacteria bacterium]
MKNIPRIFVDQEIESGVQVPIARDVSHYLSRVMRTNECLAFNSGIEYFAHLTDDGRFLSIGEKTSHVDPSNNITLMFAPIKRTDDLINMATQMGVAKFQPVITDRTNANHINWERMKKIAIEASEQSNRNSVPQILSPIKFSEINLSDIVFADERAAYGHNTYDIPSGVKNILVGPEGGFSDSEFVALDNAGAHGISLGKTILRAEVASVIALAKVIK